MTSSTQLPLEGGSGDERQASASEEAQFSPQNVPLHRISAPHANDVLLRGPPLENSPQVVAQHPGNRRFQLLLDQYAEEYQSKSSVERPLVACQIMNRWRQSHPPGRFLKFDAQTNLWNDVGDKKTREKISNMLKKRNNSISEEEKLTGSFQRGGSDESSYSEQRAPSSSIIDTTHSQPFQAHWERRISAKLDHTLQQNNIYGRLAEKQRLVDAFQRHLADTPLVCIITGSSGTGKTALAHSMPTQSAMFVSGHFEKTTNNEAFQVFQSVLRDFARQAMPNSGHFQTSLRQEFPDNREWKLLLAAVPELQALLDHTIATPTSTEPYQSYTVRVMINLFLRFVQAVASPERPLIIFIDDLHRANEASWELIISMASDLDHRAVFFMGAMTTNINNNQEQDDATATRLERLNSALQSKKIETQFIHLDGIEEDHIGHMLSDTLHIANDQAQELGQIVSTMTQGNMHYVRQFLRTLQEDELVRYDEQAQAWKVDCHLIRTTMMEMDFYRFLQGRTREMSPDAQELITIASCFGSIIPENLLEHIFPDVKNLLREATMKGLLKFDSFQETFRFASDDTQKVAHGMIPEDGRAGFHDRLGRRLWKKLDEKELEENIFDVLDQLMMGGNFKEQEKTLVAAYCLKAGEKAFGVSNFAKALTYLQLGISLVGSRGGWRDHYELSLKLHNAACEAYYCTSQPEQVEELVKEVNDKSRSFQDTLQARATYIHSLGSFGRPTEAIDSGLATLALLKETLPAHPTGFQVARFMIKTEKLMKKRSPGWIRRMPILEDPAKLAVLQILNTILLYALYVRPNLLPVLAARMVQITLESGICAASGVGFGYYSMMICR